ncbi:flagellar filament capping protein FliD [Actimicrobium sp. CCI2.3]|uniref:flagellar filament capping protein FliD n=1 Tax=Actimicrobium sp. CCI2.3 TaxID=3048616 RepID=UPI002AB533BF|nr:flagellar filament capping protein FliD [Actimicrobium sp. CCI2.3]MDY7573027.1 flagellar filament capping protein FliD [Actimicrobium sp. CCI2.3]MEB0020824.1 flagellar filament capping protein FliD [Actimicrobium sp. CCI2.3]
MSISAPGIGSSLDVNSIVSQLIAIDSQPLTTLTKKQASFQAKLSAMGSVKSSLSSFQSAVSGLSNITKFQAATVSSSDATVASASGSSIAVPGTYSLQVTSLAQAQKLVAPGQVTTNTAVGSGTLTFDFGTISGGSSASGKYTGSSFTSNAAGVKTVTIDPGNNTLAGIRDAINGASIGVTATILNDGGTSPYRLVLTQTNSGVSNSMKIAVSGDAGLSGLLGQDPAGTQAMTENQTAANALFSVDGIAVSKNSNTVTDVLPGVTLNLLGKTAVGASTSLTVARDTAAITASVTEFVSAFNKITETLNTVSAFDTTTNTAAVLNGDSSIRAIQTQIRNVLNAPVAGGNSAYSILSEIGVSLQKTGELTLDSTKLTAAVKDHYADIAGLFAAVGKTTDSQITYTAATTNTKPGAYAVNILQLATQGSAVGLSAVTGAGSAKTTGSAVANLLVDGSNDSLTVLLNGVSASISLTQKTYSTAADLAAEVQTRINAASAFTNAGASATVTNNAGVLTISSNKTGSASAASVTGGNGKTSLMGSAPTITAGFDTAITTGLNDTLDVQLNGVNKTITLAAGNYSFASLAVELQGKINGATEFSSLGSAVKVTQNAGVLSILSNTYGANSFATITTGTAMAALFGGSPTTTRGLDVKGTINGAAAVGIGQLLTGATGDASEGLTLVAEGVALGARGTINYSQGYAFQLNTLLTGMLGANGPVTSRTDGLSESIKSNTKSQTALKATIAANEKRYRAQYTALDSVISKLNTTSTYLTQQLAAIAKNS